MTALSPLADRFVSAFNARDGAVLHELVTDDVVIYPFRSVLEDAVYHGHEGLDQWLGDLVESWVDLQIEPLEAETRPGLELVSARISGVGAESQARTEALVWWVVELRDGVVARIRTFTDEDAARAAYDAAAA